jgi:hypothetical protein
LSSFLLGADYISNKMLHTGEIKDNPDVTFPSKFIDFILIQLLALLVAHTCNPSYLGGEIRRIEDDDQTKQIVLKTPSPK